MSKEIHRPPFHSCHSLILSININNNNIIIIIICGGGGGVIETAVTHDAGKSSSENIPKSKGKTYNLRKQL